MSGSEDGNVSFLPFICVGHSHIASIAKAASDGGELLEAINIWDRPESVIDASGAARFAEPMVEKLRVQEGSVFSLLGGNSHIILGTMAHPRRFDFVLPSEPGLPLQPNAELVPSGAVSALLAKAARPYVRLLQELASLSDGPVHHMESPPPCPDQKMLWRTVAWVRDWFPGMLEEIAPPVFRYKMWRLHSDYIRSVCRPLGVEFIPVPAESQTPDGFMKTRYSEDGNHGNAVYGQLILDLMGERT